jgi:uncharacterized UBP type Zn finger protein
MMHFKWFYRETYRKKKVITNIQFPEVLDMTSRIHGSNANGDSKEKLTYHLTAVLIHNGPSASSGHYVGNGITRNCGAHCN